MEKVLGEPVADAPLKKEGQHTPGPWYISLERSDAHRKLIGVGDSARERNDGYWVAHTLGPDCEANARLIAAAPELLEVCQMMAVEFSNEDGVFFQRHPSVSRLIEAISKATSGPSGPSGLSGLSGSTE